MGINKLSKSIRILIIFDFTIFLFGFLCVLLLLKHNINSKFVVISVLTSLSWSYILSLKGFYRIKQYNFLWKDSYHFLEAIFLGMLIPVILISLFSKFYVLYVLLTSLLVYPMLLGWRIGFNSYIKHFKKHKNVLVVGAGNAGKIVAREIKNYPKLKYNIVGFIDDDPDKANTEISGIKVLGTTSDIKRIVKDTRTKIVIIAINKPIEIKSMSHISECANKDVTFFKMTELYECITSKIPVKSITPDWFIYDLTRVHRPVYRFCKRIFDIIGASIITLVMLPIMVTLAVSIKMADGGKIFYTQDRVGKNGEIFNMLKFRTMIEKAEEDGAVWAVNNNEDPRVTKIGRIARKLRFDELPQMFNIIRGEMSLIGPRPERPEFTRMLEKEIPFYQRRHWVTPGWTGWAQIMYRYGASVDDALEKLRYDLYYIKHRNVFWDFSILIKAIAMALGGRHG